MTFQPDLTFISAADARYWRCLYQLLRAAKRRGWDQFGHWIAYDIDVPPHRRANLERAFPWVTFRTFDLSPYPDFYVPARGTYAWKPALINQALQQAPGPLIWMDSANIPTADPTAMITHTRKHGIYLLRGQAPLSRRCDPKVLDALNVPSQTRQNREYVTGIVGLNAADPRIRALTQRWAQLSAQREIIRPLHLDIPRHMNDQAVLNALVLPLVDRGEITLPDHDVDISSGTPIRFMSTRNKLGPDAPLWLDPLARAYYWTYKTIDQWLIRRKSARAPSE
jgi:hypothetical protein